MKPVVLLPRAEVDLVDAAIWYENEREGLGPAFEADSDRLVSRIEWSPFQFPEIDPGIRRAMLSRFPFGIYFAIEPDEVVVFAVLHLHRDPQTWRERSRLGSP